MKNINHILGFFLSLALITSCQDDDLTIGDIVSPNNIELSITYMDDGVATTAPGLGSGVVEFTASATNAISYHLVIQGITVLQTDGVLSHNFTVLGTNIYDVTVVAYGSGGVSASKTFQVEVLALYEPPADLLEMLHANSSRTWKIASDVNNHFGLGPVGGTTPAEWYGAGPGEKADTGMYDDRYTFNVNGTLTHDTGEDGWIFGRSGLISELDAVGGSGGEADGDDIIQYVFNDYTENWTLTAPGDVETLSLTGIGFLGYYIGGDHKYIIHSRSANEMIVTSTDGNGGFNWWFTLIPE